MKIGIMQPYFFPYVGYFSLIKHTDKWIVFDPVQFIRHGWIERNRILHPNPEKGWQYIKVPLEKHSLETKIEDIKIKSNDEWRKRMISQFSHYKKAPYYRVVKYFLETTFNYETTSITKLNAHMMNACCNYLNIPFNYEIFSESNIVIDPVNAPDEWALNISKALGATEYYSLPNAKAFFNKKKYDNNNIILKFLSVNLKEYNQKRPSFEPALSILDVMMFNSPEEINLMLGDFILE